MALTPIIETERLVLRPYRLADVLDVAALWGDPATAAFIGNGQPPSAEGAWSRVLRPIGHWQAMVYGYGARPKADGRFVGEVGFQNLRRAICSPRSTTGRRSAAWLPLGPGPRLGPRSRRSAPAWADAALATPEGACIIRPAHERSIRLALAAGYRRTGSVRHDTATEDMFVRARVFTSATLAPTS